METVPDLRIKANNMWGGDAQTMNHGRIAAKLLKTMLLLLYT
jgi:hypothetical protein